MSKDKEQALDYKNMLAVCDGGANYQGVAKKYSAVMLLKVMRKS